MLINDTLFPIAKRQLIVIMKPISLSILLISIKAQLIVIDTLIQQPMPMLTFFANNYFEDKALHINYFHGLSIVKKHDKSPE